MYLDIALVLTEILLLSLAVKLFKDAVLEIVQDIRYYKRYKEQGYQFGYPTAKEALQSIKWTVIVFLLFLIAWAIPFFVVLHFLTT